MEENKKVIYQTAKVAAKWWADRIDGTIIDVIWSKDFVAGMKTVFEFIRHPELAEIFDSAENVEKYRLLNILENETKNVDKLHIGFINDFVNERERKIYNRTVFPMQRERFERILTELISEKLDKNGCAYLCSNGNGTSANPVSFAAEKSEIETDEKGPFIFGDYIEMYVERDKIVARFNEEDYPETVYCPKEGWEYINKKMDQQTQSREELIEEIIGKPKNSDDEKNNSDGKGGM